MFEKRIHIVVYRYNWFIFIVLQHLVTRVYLNVYPFYKRTCELDLGTILNNTSGAFMCSCTQYCFPVGYTLERGIAGSQNKCMFNFTAICGRFFVEIVFIYTLNRSVWKFHFFHILDNTWYCQYSFNFSFLLFPSNLAILVGMQNFHTVDWIYSVLCLMSLDTIA